MSQTFCLVCHKTRKKIWIGQGWNKMTSFYTDTKTIGILISFLNDQIGESLEFVCNDTTEEEICEYEEY